MSDEPTPRGRRALPARRRPAGDLARDLTIAHAKARAAGHLLTRDPAAAARALHDISRHTRAALDALDHPAPGGAAGAARAGTGLGELPTGFRAGGGALRVSVVGVQQPLDPAGGSMVRLLAAEALQAATTHLPGADLSFSLTWSPEHLEVLVVGGAPLGPTTGPTTVPADAFERSRAVVAAVAGTLRLTAPSAGGFVVAVRLPLGRTPDEDGSAPADEAVTSRARSRTGARIQA